MTGGASSGIGRATVLKLTAAGCRVAALGRDAEGLGRLVDEVDVDGCDSVWPTCGT